MLHESKFGDHAHKLPSDRDGNVPEAGDDWRNMNFDHGELDPHEEGISDDERARRMDQLDTQWWPQVIAQVNKQKEELGQLPGGSPIRKWREEVMRSPHLQHGFEPGEIDESD